MGKNYRAILLTILTLSVLVIAIIELTGVGGDRWGWRRSNSYIVDKDHATIYRGEIHPENLKTRDQMVAEMPKTTMQFYETRYSFGAVSEGDVLKHTFRYKNTGHNPLMISKTDVTCGCTTYTFTQEAIPPGADGTVTVEFDTHGYRGFQQKSFIIHSNAIPEAASVGIDADVK